MAIFKLLKLQILALRQMSRGEVLKLGDRLCRRKALALGSVDLIDVLLYRENMSGEPGGLEEVAGRTMTSRRLSVIMGLRKLPKILSE